MRKMFSEEQIRKIAGQGDTPLYIQITVTDEGTVSSEELALLADDNVGLKRGSDPYTLYRKIGNTNDYYYYQSNSAKIVDNVNYSIIRVSRTNGKWSTDNDGNNYFRGVEPFNYFTDVQYEGIKNTKYPIIKHGTPENKYFLIGEDTDYIWFENQFIKKKIRLNKASGTQLRHYFQVIDSVDFVYGKEMIDTELEYDEDRGAYFSFSTSASLIQPLYFYVADSDYTILTVIKIEFDPWKTEYTALDEIFGDDGNFKVSYRLQNQTTWTSADVEDSIEYLNAYGITFVSDFFRGVAAGAAYVTVVYTSGTSSFELDNM